MLIFNSINMIYIHPHKTGGEAVEHAFASAAKENDWMLDSQHLHHLQEYENRYGLNKHSSAAEVAAAIGMDVWGRYFTWGTVRNPYARIVSLYNYFAAITEPELESIGYPLHAPPTVQRDWIESKAYSMTDQWAFAGVRAYLITRSMKSPFSEFLRHPLLVNDEPAYLSQFSRLCNTNRTSLLIKRHAKQEFLSEFWRSLCSELNLPELQLLTINATPAKWKRTIGELLDRPADVELINKIYAEDFRWFDYEPMGVGAHQLSQP